MTSFEGGCHCGNLGLRFETDQDPAAMPVRACACGFCRRHRTRTVADPAGRARVTVRDPALLSRYRFALGTADYLVCRACGVYLGAVFRDADGAFLLVNSPALAARDRFTQVPLVVDYDTESASARRARRKAAWTPVTFDPPGVLDG